MEESLRVFIADSDPEHGRHLAELVRRNPRCDVLGISQSGRETLAAVEQLHPDALLLALALHELDGLFVLERLSTITLIRYPRVAVISAMADRQSEQVYRLGADICLAKPVHEPSLLRWLEGAEQTPALARSGMAARRHLAAEALDRMGMMRSFAGYAYLVEAVAIAASDHLAIRRMMSGLYQDVAGRFETTVACVERSIRRAVEETWTNGPMNETYALFGYSVDPQRGKPTNRECIARLAEYIRFALSEVGQGPDA